MIFENNFIRMDLPAGWSCISNKTNTTWICQSANEALKNESMMVLAGRPVTAKDTLADFQSILAAPKLSKDAEGKPLKSTVQFQGTVKLSGTEWVDATHASAELRSFNTRYLMTTYEGNAIGVTFSAYSSKYAQYAPVFDSVLKSIQLKKAVVNQTAQNHSLPQTDGSVAVAPIVGDGDRVAMSAVKGGAEDRKPAGAIKNGTDIGGALWIGAGVMVGLIAISMVRKRLRAED